MTKFNIDSFALELMRKVWEIGNRHGPDSQRKAQIQVAIAEAVGPLMTQQQAEPSQVPTGHVFLPEITPEMWETLGDTDVMTWIDGPQWTQIAVDFASMLPVKMPAQQPYQDRLRFKSACEISGDKHPEYVRGYEAAMDAVCKAQQAGEPVALRYTNDGALAECPCCGSLDVGGAHDTVNCYRCGLAITKKPPLKNAIDAWNKRARYTAPQAQPAPIQTAWHPIDTAPTDVLHVRGLWVYDEKGKPLSFDCDVGRIDDDGFFVDEFGNPHGWSAGDYTHWHPLEVPPAPGGE